MGFPVEPGALTAPWLTDSLRACGALTAARVDSFTCTPVDSHNGMTGVLVRLRLNYDVAEPGAPRTLVAKFSHPDADFRAMVHSMGFFEREVRFYSEFAADVPVTVPRCYYGGIDEVEGWSLLLLEDLAPARPGSWVRGSSLEELRVAIAGIAAVHATWWQSARLDASPWLTMTSYLSPARMQEVVAQVWDAFLARLCVPVTPAIAEVGELASHHLQEAATYLFETPPLTLVHHDFDGDNLCFPIVDGRLSLAVFDWQLATRAHAALDIGWLIGGQCEPDVRRAHELDLVRSYHGMLVGQGVTNYSFTQCWDDYRLSMLLAVSRLVGAVGMNPGPPGGHWDTIAPRYCEAIRDLEVGELVTSMSSG